LLNQLILHSLLLRTDAIAETVVAKFGVEGLFVWSQGWQVAGTRVCR
jgi:hypothetical protein